jgi:hypothetical protein
MGFLDDSISKAKDAVEKAVDEHGDKIKDGADKLGKVIDDKTGGKHTDQIDKGKKKLEEALDRLDGKRDDFGPPPPER